MSGEKEGNDAPPVVAAQETSSDDSNPATTAITALPSSDPTTTTATTTTIMPSTAVSTVALEGYLLQTLLDLQCRSEVEATLHDLVTDVELAVNLQHQLQAQTHQHQAERIIAAQELALEETHVVQHHNLQAQTLLADALVKDLWGLSKEVGSLLELKQKHDAMILEYDELMAKLAQAEEDLYAARRNPPPPAVVVAHEGGGASVASEKKSQQPSTVSPPQPPKQPTPPPQKSTPAPVPVAPQPSATMVKLPEKKPKPSSEESATAKTEAKTEATSTEKPPAALKSDPDEPETTAATATPENSTTEPTGNPFDLYPDEPPTTKKSPVVALVEDDDDTAEGGDHHTRVTLETIDMEILMRIFGFLDAYDILNTAQVNISMYSRVDSLFGFGMDGGGGASAGDDNVSTTSTLATTPTVAAATTASVSTATTAKSTPAASTTTTTTTTATAAAKRAPESHNPIFGQRLVGGGRNIFNMLQGGVVGAAAAVPPAAAAKRAASPKGPGARGRSGSDANDGNKPPLSEAMAHSMAAKLNDAEINAIISMTEKLRTKEKQVSLLIKEKEELEGKLNGSEAVKDFLITKVRDMEKIMNKSDETEKKVTQQIASDQEVIAFLDGRVQELERMTRVLQKEKTGTQEKLKSVVSQNDKKVSVLSDMLQFERQKLKENEREWKATKKLLVKEVKGCRAHIAALQAERDGFREQNDALRKAVMASGSSSLSNGRSSSPHR